MPASSTGGSEDFNQETPWGGCISALDTNICPVSLRCKDCRRAVLQHALRCWDMGTGHSEGLAPRFCFRGSDAVSIWRPIMRESLKQNEEGWFRVESTKAWEHTQIVVKCQWSDTAYLIVCKQTQHTQAWKREQKNNVCLRERWGSLLSITRVPAEMMRSNSPQKWRRRF